MDEVDGVDGHDVRAGHNCPAQRPLEGGSGESRKQKAESRNRDDGMGRGMAAVQATEEERAAIRAMLSRRAECAPAGAGVGRASALAWAGLRLAAFVLLAAGVGIGLGDGDEFDDVGCSVAQQPGGTSHAARSAQARERAGGKLPGSDSGSAGPSGDDGPYGGKAETLKTESRNETTGHGLQDYGGKAEVGKRETFPVNLLKQVLDSTTEELAAIKCILGGGCFADRQKGASTTQQGVSAERPGPAGGLKVARGEQASQAAPLASPPSEQPRYALQWDGTLWHLTFEGREASLKHEQGIYYVAEMLGQPGERVRKLNLAAKYSSPRSKHRGSIEVYDPATGKYDTPAGTEPVHEAPLAADDDEARNAYKARARELKDTLDDPTETEAAKAEAREELEHITAHLSKDSRQLRDPTKAAADAIRSAIKKLLQNLSEPGGSTNSPHSVRRAFAEHLQRYLIIPSRRYAAPRARKARGDLTGCLLYEPPAGTSWVISF